jgi:uncharacterized protein YndB with AHSA1/START domain
MRILTSITIPAPREAVWHAFINVERWPEWSPWELRFHGEARLAIGAPFFVRVPAPFFPFVTLEFPCRVDALENPRLISWTGSVLRASGYHRFAFEDVPDGCRVVSEEELRGPGTLLLRPARPIIEPRVMDFLSRLSRQASLSQT